MEPEYAIVTKGLTKKYRSLTAVDHLDLRVRRGELLSLLGVNGAGKTTTVKLLSGLARPTEGDAWLLGRSIVKETAAAKALLAVSPQESAVARNLTVRENLEFMAGIHGRARDDARAKADTLLEKLGLRETADRRAGKLSGGFQRRLSIAMALISEPEILFLDEPTLGLDVLARSELWELVGQLKGSVTILLTTHYMEEAEALSDRVAILGEGRLLFCGSAEEIKEKAGSDSFSEAFVRLARGGEKA